jgi:WD40 repeat protein
VRQYIGHTEGILPVAVSPDGKLIASEAHDETVRIWELATGKELHKLPGHTSQGTSNLAFSPNSKALATVGGDNALRLYDTATGKEVLKLDGHGDDVNSLDFSPDGKLPPRPATTTPSACGTSPPARKCRR